MNRKARDFAQVAKKYGFILARRTKHCVWIHPETGARVVSAFTTSDHRAVKNFESRLRKATTDPLYFKTNFQK